MRKGRPAIIGYRNIHNSILKYSKDIKSHLNIIDKDFFYEENSKKKWIFSNRDGLKIECKNPSMKGDIQINNAATAIQAIHCCEDIILECVYVFCRLSTVLLLKALNYLNFHYAQARFHMVN